MHVIALPPTGVIWNNMRHINTGRSHSFSLRLVTLRKSFSLLDWALPGAGQQAKRLLGVQQHLCLHELEQSDCARRERLLRLGTISSLTFSSGVGENIFSSWGCLEKSKG